MIKLVCPECQRQNEPERIYCHDCGARLDRSALAKEASKAEDPQEMQRRLKRMLDPGHAKMRLTFLRIGKLLLGSFALALLIQMLVPPDVPERIQNAELIQINLALEHASTDPNAAPMQYPEEQVNSYLFNVTRTKRAALSGLLQFERAIANFDEGSCRMTTERSLFGFSLYCSISHNVALKNGALTASINGGSIGRMPIHPAIMKFGESLFSDLWSVLERERKLVSKMGAIEFHPKTVILFPMAAKPGEPSP